MEKIDKIYEKIHPGYFALIGVIIFLIGIIPAMLVESDFSFFATYIYRLTIPSNDLYILNNISKLISAIFQMIFFFGFTRYLQEKGSGVIITWSTFILGAISSIGMIGSIISVAAEAYDVQIIFLLMLFFGAILYLFSYAYIEWRSSGFSIVQALFNIIVAIFFIIYLIGIFVTNFGRDIPLEFRETFAFTGWLYVFAMLIWFVENGIYTLLKK
ncbi:MAG: hypothetical protein ACXACX_02505 [Candidatus Hodarchaeales archaeon]|jgi:hypothetical protein